MAVWLGMIFALRLPSALAAMTVKVILAARRKRAVNYSAI
jgi:hypothetical protein